MDERISHFRQHTLATQEMLRLPVAAEFWGVAGPDLRRDAWYLYEPSVPGRIGAALRRVAGRLAARWRGQAGAMATLPPAAGAVR